jgi:flagellar FliJ protein
VAQFTFKLRAVLRQREVVEQGCQREVAVLEADRVAVKAEMTRLDETLRAALTDLRQNQLRGELNLSFLAAHRRFMFAMQRQAAVLIQKLDAAQKKVDAARVKLAEAAKQRRIIEKLRERQHATWAEAINRKETAAMDEIAMQMTTENMREQWANGVGETDSESETDSITAAESDMASLDQPENRL